MAWPARRSPNGDSAFWTACALCFLALVALVVAGLQDPGGNMLAWAVAAVPFGVVGSTLLLWGLAYRQLTYVLDETELRIRWLGRCYSVPYAAIEGIYTGQRLIGHSVPEMLSWPGIYVGPGRVRGLGRLRFFATSQDPAALTLLTFDQGGVVLSVASPHEFRLALISQVEQVPEEAVSSRPAWQRTPVKAVPWPAVHDRWLWVCAGVGVVLLLFVLAVICLRFDALAPVVPVRFDANGDASQFASRGDLLRLPLLGFLALVFDLAVGVWISGRDALVARLLWVGGPVTLGVLLVAVVRLAQ